MPVQHAEQTGRHEVADYIAFLQQAGEETAILGRQCLQGERSADSPHAAHRDTEECTTHKEALQRGCESRGKFEDRERDDVDHQRGPASVAFRKSAEEEGAYWPHRKRPEDRLLHLFSSGVKGDGDCRQAKGEEEEIERIQRPAEKAGRECIALLRSQRAELTEKTHAPNRTIRLMAPCLPQVTSSRAADAQLLQQAAESRRPPAHSSSAIGGGDSRGQAPGDPRRPACRTPCGDNS